MRAKLLWTAAMAVLLSGPALADPKAGVDAWERGDYRRAVDEWRKDAEAGDPDAQFNLGQAYKLGRGVPLDTRQAENWYARAAAKGHVQPKDAIPWLEKSVSRGEPRAQYILGTMLFNGVDVKKDWVRAYALTSRAASAGLPQATQSQQQMDAYVSAAERQQGLALAKRMDGTQVAAIPGELAGRGKSGGVRGIDLPPSEAGRAPRGLPPAPTLRDRASPNYGATAEAPPPIYVPPPPVKRPAAVAQAPAPVRGGGWKVQLGAFGDPGNARKLGGSVAGRFPGRSVDYVKAGALTKVLVGPFASRAEAAAACGSLKPCVPVGP
jgi:cell division septation protein DedD